MEEVRGSIPLRSAQTHCRSPIGPSFQPGTTPIQVPPAITGVVFSSRVANLTAYGSREMPQTALHGALALSGDSAGAAMLVALPCFRVRRWRRKLSPEEFIVSSCVTPRRSPAGGRCRRPTVRCKPCWAASAAKTAFTYPLSVSRSTSLSPGEVGKTVGFKPELASRFEFAGPLGAATGWALR